MSQLLSLIAGFLNSVVTYASNSQSIQADTGTARSLTLSGGTGAESSGATITLAGTTFSGSANQGEVLIATGTNAGSQIRTRIAGTQAMLLTDVSGAPKLSFPATNTAAGTTGAQTINKISGTVNFAASATSLVVTNSLCTAASLVFAVVRSNDTTSVIKNVVPGAGSFTITLNAGATAETSVGFFIIN